MILHVSNLHLNTSEADLRKIFALYGDVQSVQIVRNKLNHRSWGRAFIDMAVEKEGQKAVKRLHGQQCFGKAMAVREVVYDPTCSAHSFKPEN